MNKSIIKTIKDKIPEPLKYFTASYFRNKLINDKDFLDYCKLLDHWENINLDKIKEYQLNQLKSVLDYSYKNVPYYTDLFNNFGFNPMNISSSDDINILPFLTKSIIQENFNKLTSIAKVSGGHYLVSTGGTTGEPLTVLLDYKSIFKENSFIYHFRKKIGYQYNDKLATFRGVDFGNRFWKYNPMHNEIFISPFKLSNQTIHKYFEKITRFNPQYLNGYLSCIYLFAKLLQDNNLILKPKLKGIFLISENIDQGQRNFIEGFFNVKSLTFYGHSERCVIAEEEEPNLYKISPLYGHTELIQQANGYQIVGTGFLNRTMPLIRYKTGDICQKVNNLVSIQGRWNVEDYLIGLNNEKIFHSAFNFHGEIFKNVMNYQFHQTQKGKSELLLIVNKNFKSSQLEFMKKEIDKKTGGIINFDIKIVESLLLSPRGKFMRFVSEIKNN